MNKTWLDHYPQGVSAEVDIDAHRTLVDILQDSCGAFGPTPAYSNMDCELTYAELDARSRDFAAYLQNELDFAKGDRVALMMPNLLQYPIALFGILRAGMVAVNINPLYTARELEYQLSDASARAIVIVENFATTLESVVDKVALEAIITTQIGDCLPRVKRIAVNFAVKHIKRMVPAFKLPGAVAFNTVLADGGQQQMKPVTITSEDLAFLQYTGGTTGRRKGAKLTHHNLVANLTQCDAWLEATTERGQELILTPLPLYHVFALTANCLVFLQQGGKNVLITNPRDIPALVQQFKKHRPTAFTGVNTLFNALVNNDTFAKLDFSRLKLTLGGGAPVQTAVAERWQAITGVPLIEAYGLTETSPAICINPLDLQYHNGSIGLPIPSTEVSIRDDDGRELESGQPGELCVRGPQVMAGYWHQPEETEKAFFADGFLRTGDIAQMDDKGYFYIVDRKKDLILVSGFNVYPNEVEDVVASHPKVMEAACIGVEDEKSGEAVKVFVVKKDASLDADELIAFCREELTAYKVPRHVVFVDDLPKSNVGKISRKELRDREKQDKKSAHERK